MRIAYVVGAHPAGTGAFTRDEVRALETRAHLVRCAVVASQRHEDWLSPGGTVSLRAIWELTRSAIRRPRATVRAVWPLLRNSRTPRDASAAVRAAMAACYFARHVSVDVVHAQFAGPAAATAYSWNALTGIPYTVRAHAYDIYAGYGWLKTVLSSSIGVIAISRDGQEQVERRFGRRSALVRVGIPADGIPARPRSDPQSPFRFLSVGALSEKKGHGLAIKAVQILLADGEQVSLDIYGAGPLRPALTRLIQSTPQIRLRGTLTTSEMRERYQHYDAFLMTPRVGVDNDREGIPVVIMEAMAARLPVACTVVGGMAELVRDGVTGTVLPSDPLAVAERLHRLTDDYPRALALTDDALSTVRSEHELKTNTNALLHLWEEALARSHAT